MQKQQASAKKRGAAKTRVCPNCGSENVENHPEDGCVLAVLIQVIRERQSISERKLRTIHATTDVDALWDDLGPIIDRLEDGHYSS